MQVPNSLFTIYAVKGRSYEDICPSYYELLYRAAHRPNADGVGGLDVSRTLAHQRGIDIRPYPTEAEGVSEGTRYRLVTSIESEHASLQDRFKNLDVHTILPIHELRRLIGELMQAEGERLVKLATPAQLSALHPSYIEFGLTAPQTRALQDAGYPNRNSCKGVTLAELNMVHGIDIAIAAHLISESHGLKKIEIEVVSGVTVKKAEAKV